jgi:hypothetical protein
MKWFKANINGTGFYRVGYPRENWDALVNALIKDHKVFSVADRAQLINDAFSLSMYVTCIDDVTCNVDVTFIYMYS